jgi:hypothetical protein
MIKRLKKRLFLSIIWTFCPKKLQTQIFRAKFFFKTNKISVFLRFKYERTVANGCERWQMAIRRLQRFVYDLRLGSPKNLKKSTANQKVHCERRRTSIYLFIIEFRTMKYSCSYELTVTTYLVNKPNHHGFPPLLIDAIDKKSYCKGEICCLD